MISDQQSEIRNPQSEIELPVAFAEQDDVDGLKQDPEIKEEGQV